MTYIENVFVCMAAPLVVALLSLKRGQRAALVFCLAGMGACLLSAYLNTFFARLYQADAVNAATQIAPVVEEVMKLLPLLFLQLPLIQNPKKKNSFEIPLWQIHMQFWLPLPALLIFPSVF